MSNGTQTDRAKKQEAILAREIIDLANKYGRDADTLESISEICFALSRFFEEIGYDKVSAIDWNALFSFYDRKYVQGTKGNESEGKGTDARIYDVANQIIASDKQANP